MDSREFDALTRDATSNMSRRKVLGFLGRALVAALGFRWIVNLGTPKASAQVHCGPLTIDGTCPSGTYKRRKPGFQPYYNGCGGEGITKDLVPNYFLDANFTPACNKHDLCYSDCSRTKKQCDDDFYDDLVDVCRKTYPGFWDSVPRGLCESAAWGYYTSVNSFGNSFWADAQIEGCQCCY